MSQRKPRSKQTLLSPRLPNRHSITNLNCATAAAKNEELLVQELFSPRRKEESVGESESEKSKVYSSRNPYLGGLEEVEEVSDESPTPKVEDSLNKKLDDILESEKGDTFESESVIMEGEEEQLDQEFEGVEEDVDVEEEDVEAAPEEDAAVEDTEDVGEEDAFSEEGREVEGGAAEEEVNIIN